MKSSRLSRYAVVGLAVGMLSLGQAMGEKTGYPKTVTVGNPNNIADDTGFGSVSYEYRIGKFEVTIEEYCEFLNAAAKADDYGLWRWQLGKPGSGGIRRSGESGSYTYTPVDGMAKKPAVLMNWNEVLRFCNWLTNGKGDGSLDKGAYTFTEDFGIASVKVADHALLAEKETVTWVLASEDEWYKAAYYDPKMAGGGGYREFPSADGGQPKSNLGSGKATDVGTFADSPSPYGTFDQGGNVWEWNETKSNGRCGVRGGSYWFNDTGTYMHAKTRYVTNPPEFIYDNYGFRVVALGGTKTKK